MPYIVIGSIFFILLLTLMIIFMYLGKHYAQWQRAKYPQQFNKLPQVTEGAVLGLMALLIAFTFSSANTKFDARRQLVIQEANDIGTAYTRLDLLPASAQAYMKKTMKRYLQSRLTIYEKMSDAGAMKVALDNSIRIQADLWENAVKYCSVPQMGISCMLLLPSLNTAFSTANTRMLVMQIHQPYIVLALLVLVALISALLVGYSTNQVRIGSSPHFVSYCLVIALTIYIIIDMEYPRLGFIRVNSIDSALVSTLVNMPD